MAENRGAYYALCPDGCGAAVYACVDSADHKRDTAKSNAEMTRKGLTVRYADDLETVRPLIGMCKNRVQAARRGGEGGK